MAPMGRCFRDPLFSSVKCEELTMEERVKYETGIKVTLWVDVDITGDQLCEYVVSCY
jgi:hypothetical protein